jgi:hypothetical protein
LQTCRNIDNYSEEASPNPLVVFFTDGENTGPDVTPAAQVLKAFSLCTSRTRWAIRTLLSDTRTYNTRC